jgi:Raf kinase inhibitor-like YbhB/YbcL family protein
MRSSRSLTSFIGLLFGASVPLITASCSSSGDDAGAGGTGAAGGAGGAGGGAGTATAGQAPGGAPGAGTGGAGGTAGTGTAGGTAGKAAGGATAGGTAGTGAAGASSGGTPAGGATSGGAPAGGAGSGAGGATSGGAPMGGMGVAAGQSGQAGMGPTGEFTLTSPVHMEGAMFADKYTCAAAGFNGSLLPELHWTAGPAGTKSYAITFIDRDLAEATPPSALGYHWVIYNIPATTLTLPESFKMEASIGAKENNDFLGPCPNFPSGSATHTYEFIIYALEQEMITIAGTGTTAAQNAETQLEAMHLAKAKLSGTSNATPP